MAGSTTGFAAGVLAYTICTFNGGYLWHLTAFHNEYVKLGAWTRFDEPILALGVCAILLQVWDIVLCDYSSLVLPHRSCVFPHR